LGHPAGPFLSLDEGVLTVEPFSAQAKGHYFDREQRVFESLGNLPAASSPFLRLKFSLKVEDISFESTFIGSCRHSICKLLQIPFILVDPVVLKRPVLNNIFYLKREIINTNGAADSPPSVVISSRPLSS
jgi:hypothetical protein